MALALGTNCGFVTEAPVADPAGTSAAQDYEANATSDTAPTTGVVIEMGWWCDNATQAADFDIGIYNNKEGLFYPENVISSSLNNAKGITAGWKRITGLNIPVTEGVLYWLVLQIDNTSTTTNGNYTSGTGGRIANLSNKVSLPDPWPGTSSMANYSYGIYALIEAAPSGTNQFINIGDVWKQLSEVYINVGDVWRSITAIYLNQGDVWKDCYVA